MRGIVDYDGFGDFSDEMRGYAEALDIDLGYCSRRPPAGVFRARPLGTW